MRDSLPREPELQRRLVEALDEHFAVTEQVWLRHPIYAFDLRIDAIAIPRTPLDERFPFPFLGIEVKTDNDQLGHVTQAYKQCLDYKQCVVNDQRLPNLRGLIVPCIALYRGRQRRQPLDKPWDAWETFAVRLVGKWNVGVLEESRQGNLELRVCDERIWHGAYGVTDSKTLWPVTRLVANSTRRA